MTITLYWWMLPASILTAGALCLVWPRQSSGGYIDFSGMTGALGFVLSAIVALSIVVGHYV